MQIAICDDDPMIIKELQKDLEQYFRKHHLSCPPISQFTSGEALLNNKEEKDIVFLDVEMPGLNGIYVGNTLRERYPNILIFIVTSFMEYLDDAMRFHVFRYLSKPIDRQRLFRNLDDALAQYHASSKKIAFETKDRFHTLMPSSIVMIEAISKKSPSRNSSSNWIPAIKPFASMAPLRFIARRKPGLSASLTMTIASPKSRPFFVPPM